MNELTGVKDSTGYKGDTRGKRSSDLFGDIKRRQEKRERSRQTEDKSEGTKSQGDSKEGERGYSDEVPDWYIPRDKNKSRQENWDKSSPKWKTEQTKKRSKEGSDKGTSEKRDLKIPKSWKGSNKDWYAMSGMKRATWRSDHPDSKNYGSGSGTGSRTDFSGRAKGFSANPDPDGYVDYGDPEMSNEELYSVGSVNRHLIKQYNEKNRSRPADLPVKTMDNLEYVETDTLVDYLEAYRTKDKFTGSKYNYLDSVQTQNKLRYKKNH